MFRNKFQGSLPRVSDRRRYETRYVLLTESSVSLVWRRIFRGIGWVIFLLMLVAGIKFFTH